MSAAREELGWTKPASPLHCYSMAFLVCLAAIATPLSPLSAAGVEAISVGETQITLRFDGTVGSASTFVLGSPLRIAVDVRGATPGPATQSGGLVHRVRQAQFEPQTTRIVFDLSAPALVQSGKFSADGRHLVLGLKPASEADFATAIEAARKSYAPPRLNRAAPPRSRYSVTIPLGAPTRGLPRPKIYGATGRPLVVIDAGHGGHDPGAISPKSGQREKDIALAIALKVRDQLVASGRVRVAMTREDDHFLILRERSAIARAIKADLFISIHADSAPSDTASGATIYTLSETASDREAQLLAQRENKVDVINGINLGGENSEIASILVDLAQRETMNSSANFASLLKREATRLVPFRADYHRMADLAVLKSPDMSSILFEAGYVTNSDDVARIASQQGQAQIATGIRKAVEIHFARRLAAR